MDERTITRFWSNVDKRGPEECWEWQGRIITGGYGGFNADGVAYRAHRLSYVLAFGNPGRLFVCHRCDNRPCVNPAHLFLGTTQDNTADRNAKGRQFHPVGQLNHRSKVTDEDARNIRRLIGSGMLHREVAAMYGITRCAVTMIGLRKRFRHVE